jgi:ABC-type nitrate/sulfonate/bicarbonate transport system substrate-binding protein
MRVTSSLVRLVAGLAVAGAAFAVMPASAEDNVIKVERSPVGQFEALYIAQQQGLFDKQGIKVEIKVGTSPDAALANVMSGESNLGMTGGVPMTAAVANGLPVVAVVNAQDQNKGIPTFGLVVPADSPIKTIEDLKGKKIGLPGIASPQGSALLKVLEAHGMTAKDVELVNLPFPGVLSAIESGSVDAGLPIGLFYDLSVKKGMRVFDEVFNASTFGFPAVFFAASREWADSHKELVDKFVTAMTEAAAYANDHLDEIRKVDMEQTQLPPDYLKVRDIAPFIAGFNEKAWDAENDYLLKFGFISKKPDMNDILWSGAPRQ